MPSKFRENDEVEAMYDVFSPHTGKRIADIWERYKIRFLGGEGETHISRTGFGHTHIASQKTGFSLEHMFRKIAEPEKMTVAEVSEILGYDVEIVK